LKLHALIEQREVDRIAHRAVAEIAIAHDATSPLVGYGIVK
jgi:hypothetical protein